MLFKLVAGFIFGWYQKTMDDKFKNKYRIASARLPNWDYSNNAPYFLTICTSQREHFFGEIANGKMILSELGELAMKFWMEIPIQFPFVQLYEFIVMPNHIHGIIVIGKINVVPVVETRLIASLRVPPPTIPPPTMPPPTIPSGGICQNKNPMLSENISRIIRWYKGRCSFEMRKINKDFAWQCRFHDHVIRNDAEFARITYYINQNPLKFY